MWAGSGPFPGDFLIPTALPDLSPVMKSLQLHDEVKAHVVPRHLQGANGADLPSGAFEMDLVLRPHPGGGRVVIGHADLPLLLRVIGELRPLGLLLGAGDLTSICGHTVIAAHRPGPLLQWGEGRRRRWRLRLAPVEIAGFRAGWHHRKQELRSSGVDCECEPLTGWP